MRLPDKQLSYDNIKDIEILCGRLHHHTQKGGIRRRFKGTNKDRQKRMCTYNPGPTVQDTFQSDQVKPKLPPS